MPLLSSPTWSGPDVWGETGALREGFAPNVYPPGVIAVNQNRTAIDVTGYFTQYLSTPGKWEPYNTNNRVPLVIPETEIRRMGLTRQDVITVRTDRTPTEPVGLQYDFKHQTDYVVFRVFSRHGREQVELLKMELVRLLEIIRRDTYGLLPGLGRNWLKVLEDEFSEGEKRAGLLERQVHVEVHRRWVPINTER